MTKGLERTDQEKELDELLRKGIATKQQVSMKAIGNPDQATQCRVRYDLDWIRSLSNKVLEGLDLSPIVVFDDPDTRALRIADGFHRHRAYEKAGRPAIPAYVVPGGIDDAVRFATAATARGTLSRSKDDDKRALSMLFERPEFFKWTDNRIGQHCGLSGESVKRHRLQWSATHGIAIPQEVEMTDGRSKPYSRWNPTVRPYKNNGCKNPWFRASVNGKKVVLGPDREQAERRLQELLGSRKKINLSERHALDRLLQKLDLHTEAIATNRANHRGIYARVGFGAVITSLAPGDGDRVQEAHGRLRQARSFLDNPTLRLIAVCYPEDWPPAVLDLARQDDIEFLAPEELAASLRS